jgi:two-component system phosphate regulon sensor histidine kinase PhoR
VVKGLRSKDPGTVKELPDRNARESESRGGVRLLLSSTRFIASLFWLTIIVATMVFVLPYSERTESPIFYGFVLLFIVVIVAHRYFPYEGYHPIAFFLLLLGTNALISLLYITVIIFSSAYFELLETMLITAVTCAIYFAPLAYETIDFETLKSMAIAVPIYLLIALCGYFVISKAREQEREKKALTYLFDQADTKRRELSTLYAVSLKFASTLDEAEMMTILLENARDLVPCDAIAAAILDPPQTLSIRSFYGFKESEVDVLVRESEDNPLYMSASAVLPVILKDTEEDPRFQPFLSKVGFTSMIAVPLFASASVIGVLCCFSKESDAFDDDAARLLLTLSSEAALALEKASLYRTTLEDKTKIETIINSITDGLMVIDRESRLILANPFISRLMGLQVDDYDTPLYDLIENLENIIEFREVPYREALRRVLSDGENLRNEMIFGDEQAIIFQVFWAPLKDLEGKVGGAVILLHDITDFVELDRMKSDFISIVSHELKTPLTSIKGFVRLLAAERVGPVTEKQRHYLEIVQRQTESLTVLINDLLDLSKIEAGMIDVRHDPVLLGEVVKGVLLQLENMAQEKNIDVLLEIPQDIPLVKGDSGRLTQVFMNLIHNAIKFTPHGGKVGVKVTSMGEDCLVRVTDTGIGISAQDLPKIFNKFYQVDSSSTRQQSGTGLGLSISRQLITAHGGEMWVNSTKGKGTTFSFTLPFHQPGAESRSVSGRDIGEAATG